MLHIDPKYKLIGHRGVAGLAPENTIASFAAAAKLGLNWIEFDTQLTSDKQWVVIHDATIDRTTPQTGRVSDFTLKDLTNLPAGLWFNPPNPTEHIPCLVTALKAAKLYNLNCNIEIKNSESNPKLYAKLMADFITMHSKLCITHLYTSFNLDFLIALRELQSHIAIGYLLDTLESNSIEIAKKYNFCTINLNANNTKVEDLKALQKAAIPALLYTINDKNTYKYWLRQGVSAIFSDRPDLVL